MLYNQISIDGYAACGKSTLARELAKRLKYLYIDSGAMYRAMSYYIIQNNIDLNDDRLADLLNSVNIRFQHDKEDPSSALILLNEEDVTLQIRLNEINEIVSQVAAIPMIRRKLVKLQQAYGKTNNVVMDGRDIGTVVFPKAVVKLFVTANQEIRIQRRMEENKSKELPYDYDFIKTNLAERDKIDSTRKDGPLKQAEDAILFDNSHLSRKEQLAMVLALCNCRIIH
ncbi:(d)CMP kinase [Membranihabitans marinus]|uniref:(d)CMP kinase n=1 Tax=Membranihabitans marinus TaxID=1227546 RepID=UPI001F0117C4|nr:(d)CMP kinase [Membranihabitans marinus]